ncbi:hypothetical protein [Pseudacidovorax sp. RU35E]|uniref:hypothetical protein n=1 Tax=Pseudacidovorax sp. RU35E TaxID=1907403 RepID=UPI000955200F|nr:hypothetical protein [Pseudacidovorax sp. RU35E]SIQ30930.1 hypothetical protein SAMN05880557_10352 [Pseudacidovorax sp. RU35E]
MTQPGFPQTPESSDAPADTASAAGSQSWMDAVKAFDARRPDLPGEHLVVLGLGVALLLSSGRSRSILGRLVKAAAGGALMARAASGTGGVARVAQLIAKVT